MRNSDESLFSKNLKLIGSRNEISAQLTITQESIRGVMKGANKILWEFWEGEITITEPTIGLPNIHSLLFSFLTDFLFCLGSTVLHTIMGSRGADPMPSFREFKLITLSQPWGSDYCLLCVV